MLGQNAPDDILINTYSERQIDLLGDMWTSPGRIALFYRDHRADQIRCWAFRSRLAFLFWRKQQPIFTLHERAMKNTVRCSTYGDGYARNSDTYRQYQS